MLGVLSQGLKRPKRTAQRKFLSSAKTGNECNDTSTTPHVVVWWDTVSFTFYRYLSAKRVGSHEIVTVVHHQVRERTDTLKQTGLSFRGVRGANGLYLHSRQGLIYLQISVHIKPY
jgi:hypothetical protein